MVLPPQTSEIFTTLCHMTQLLGGGEKVAFCLIDRLVFLHSVQCTLMRQFFVNLCKTSRAEGIQHKT